jgi:hypothetical protein
MFREDDCITALLEFADPDMNTVNWLERHADLYISLLVWPVGLPPLRLNNEMDSPAENRFCVVYEELMNKTSHFKDNDSGRISFLREPECPF